MKKIIDEKMFGCVKALLKGGAPYKEIMGYLGISDSTIGRIAGAESFEEYKNELKAAAYRWAQNKTNKENEPKEKDQERETAQVVEHKQTVVVQASHYMMEELKRGNKLLELINNKLGFIVEELTGKECSDERGFTGKS